MANLLSELSSSDVNRSAVPPPPRGTPPPNTPPPPPPPPPSHLPPKVAFWPLDTPPTTPTMSSEFSQSAGQGKRKPLRPSSPSLDDMLVQLQLVNEEIDRYIERRESEICVFEKELKESRDITVYETGRRKKAENDKAQAEEMNERLEREAKVKEQTLLDQKKLLASKIQELSMIEKDKKEAESALDKANSALADREKTIEENGRRMEGYESRIAELQQELNKINIEKSEWKERALSAEPKICQIWKTQMNRSARIKERDENLSRKRKAIRERSAEPESVEGSINERKRHRSEQYLE